jgi:hypothetical protein
MMINRALLALLLLATLPVAAYDEPHVWCVSASGTFDMKKDCEERWDFDSSVQPANVLRRYAFISKGQHAVYTGIIRPGEAEADLIEQNDAVIWVDKAFTGPEGVGGIVVVTEEKLGTWRFPLDAYWFREGRLQVRVSQGNWRMKLLLGGKEIPVPPDGRTVRIPDFTTAAKAAEIRAKLARKNQQPATTIVVRGRVVGKNGERADFAKIRPDCRGALCETAHDGTFRCTMRKPESNAICIDHPRLGRRRVELPSSTKEVDTGTIELVTGGTIRIMKPIHVELPEGTTIQLLRGKTAIGEPSLVDREVIELAGVAPDEYRLLLAGPEPLQRKLIPVRLDGDAEVEVILSLDAFKLTGEVIYDDRPLAGARLELAGEAWETTLETDQSGRFSAELWSPDSYSVLVKSSAMKQPYGQMMRASASDHHWRFDVPARRIFGRVIDSERSGAVANATISIEGEARETRWSRTIAAESDGSFDIGGIAEGSYTLTPRAPGYLIGNPAEIRIAKSDGDLELQLPVTRASEVRVKIVDPRGAPIAGATIVAELTPDGSNARRLYRSSDAGEAVIAVPQRSTNTIYVIPPKASFAIARVAAEASEARIVVPDGVATLTVKADKNLRYALRYQGESIPPYVLRAMAQMRGFPITTEASIPTLPPGRYEVSVGGGPWTAADLHH